MPRQIRSTEPPVSVPPPSTFSWLWSDAPGPRDIGPKDGIFFRGKAEDFVREREQQGGRKKCRSMFPDYRPRLQDQ